jgi:hypothetical protein
VEKEFFTDHLSLSLAKEDVNEKSIDVEDKTGE